MQHGMTLELQGWHAALLRHAVCSGGGGGAGAGLIRGSQAVFAAAAASWPVYGQS